LGCVGGDVDVADRLGDHGEHAGFLGGDVERP
jgi:hypothetical protein